MENDNFYNFTRLPVEILDNIFQYLSYEDLINCQKIAPQLEDICHKYMIHSTIFIEKEMFECKNIFLRQIYGNYLSNRTTNGSCNIL